MPIKKSVLAHLLSLGLNAETAPADLKKAYFSHTNQPLTKSGMTELLDAFKGNEQVLVDDTASTPASTEGNVADKTAKAKEKADAKAAKAKEKADAKATKTPATPKVAETPDAALARLKADPKTAARWARVQSVTEMGKKGPTRVTIVCDDKGPNGETLTRNIAVQDLFQVKFSAGYKKPRAKKVTAPAAEPAATA